MPIYTTATEAVKLIQSNSRIYVQAAAATPSLLTKALTERAGELRNVELCHLHTEGEAPYADPQLAESFHINSFFYREERSPHPCSGKRILYPCFLK